MDRIDIPPGSFPLRPGKERERADLKRDRKTRRAGGEASAPGILSAFELGLEGETTEIESSERDGASGRFGPERDVHDMLDEIHRLGDLVKRDYRLATVQEYKSAVRGFMQRVVRRGLRISEHASGANILNRKKYALVEVIDAKLERLAIGLVQTQGEQFNILARIDEINGLLVDLIQ